jgi:hypothetical protein
MNELLEKPRADVLVLSGESVAECDDTDMQVLLQKLQTHTETLRVVAYIRSPQSSLESILQQRVKSGLRVDIDSLVATVRNRYERLHRNFGGLLETVKFHEAVKHPYGLVAHFMELIGVPGSEIQGLAFNTSNERVTLEAYKLMEAINARYPRKEAKTHGVIRPPHDMHALMKFPGQPFQLEKYTDTALFQATLEEGAWLESELGFQFPEVARKDVEPLWQANTLVSLERAIRRLEKNLQVAAADFLVQEADSLQQSRPETAGILRHIAWSLSNIETDPARGLLESLGADYFKFAALQAEKRNPELALNLMSIASELRPGADFIGSQIEKYKGQLEQQIGASAGKPEASRAQDIGGGLRRMNADSTKGPLEGLGADYFKFAALQIEEISPELALSLMSVANELRPGAAFIKSRIVKYKEQLEL